MISKELDLKMLDHTEWQPFSIPKEFLPNLACDAFVFQSRNKKAMNSTEKLSRIRYKTVGNCELKTYRIGFRWIIERTDCIGNNANMVMRLVSSCKDHFTDQQGYKD